MPIKPPHAGDPKPAKKPKRKAAKGTPDTPLGIKLEGTQSTKERVDKLRVFGLFINRMHGGML